MRTFLPVIGLAVIVFSRLAGAGEVIAAPADPVSGLWRMLVDFGALGAFVIYLIMQRNKDNERRNKDSDRWHQLDREFVALAKDYSRVTTEVVSVLAEIRTNMHEINNEMHRLNALLASGRGTGGK